MDQKIYDEFILILEEENKEKAVTYILNLLDQKQISLPSLYLDVLKPAMYDIKCIDKKDKICIWKEHLRSAIITTIIGSVYPYVIKSKEHTNGKKIVLACPDEEYHEIGALIISQLFILAGFECYYIGANTPIEQIISAVDAVKADYLALSITNYYNTVITKELLDKVKVEYPDLKVILGGQAFENHGIHEMLYHHYHLDEYQDILKLAEEVKHETSSSSSC